MKKIETLLFVLLFSISSFASDDYLMKIEGDGVEKVVAKDEFIRIYNKNNSSVTDNKKTIDEYLVLYTNFCLKVAEAQSLGYDTMPEFIREFEGYRAQLAKPYLTDKDKKDEMVKEAYDFMKEDLNASHIMLKINFEIASPEDTLKAYNKLVEVRNRILSGENFEDLAKEVSDHAQSAAAGGELGWFTAFKFPYGFEKAAYSLKKGDISMPIRSVVGYHLIKLNDRRPAQGEIKVAHILKIAPADLPEEKLDSIKALVFDLRERLDKGEDFATLAEEYSDDKRTSKAGGELPWFGAGKMIPEFEEASFKLERNGDISDPVKVSFGYFIIKRIDKKDIPTFDDARPEIEKQFVRGPRAAALNRSFISKLKTEYEFSVNEKTLDKFYKLKKESIKDGSFLSLIDTSNALFKIEGRNISSSEFSKILKDNNTNLDNDLSVETFINNLFNSYIDSYMIDYEDSKLASKYQDFGDLVREYHDGILLFNIMDEMVWTKAIKDTLGLKEYFNNRNEEYLWPERLKAKKITTMDKKKADFIYKALIKNKKGLSEEEIVSLSIDKIKDGDTVFLKSEVYVKGDDPLVDSNWEVGVNLINTNDGAYVILVGKELLEPTEKKLDEARGSVISDFQDYLENKWINELRKKYTIDVNKALLSSLIEEYE